MHPKLTFMLIIPAKIKNELSTNNFCKSLSGSITLADISTKL